MNYGYRLLYEIKPDFIILIQITQAGVDFVMNFVIAISIASRKNLIHF